MIPLHDFKRAPSVPLVPANVTRQRYPKVEQRTFQSLFISDSMTLPFDRLLTMRPNGYRSRDRWGEATVSPFASKTHSQLQIKEEGT